MECVVFIQIFAVVQAACPEHRALARLQGMKRCVACVVLCFSYVLCVKGWSLQPRVPHQARAGHEAVRATGGCCAVVLPLCGPDWYLALARAPAGHDAVGVWMKRCVCGISCCRAVVLLLCASWSCLHPPECGDEAAGSAVSVACNTIRTLHGCVAGSGRPRAATLAWCTG